MYGDWDAYVCSSFSYPDQMHYATKRQDQVFNIKALKVILSTIIIDYFVIQLLSEPDKHVAKLLIQKAIIINLIQDTKLKRHLNAL